MKVEGYSAGDQITITQPTDILPLLYWCQNQMMDNQEAQRTDHNKHKWQRAIDYLSNLMDKVEEDGFGSYDDIENVEY